MASLFPIRGAITSISSLLLRISHPTLLQRSLSSAVGIGAHTSASAPASAPAKPAYGCSAASCGCSSLSSAASSASSAASSVSGTSGITAFSSVDPALSPTLTDAHYNPPPLKVSPWSKHYVSSSTVTDLPVGGETSNPHPAALFFPSHMYDQNLSGAYQTLKALKTTKKPGYGLVQPFYTHPHIYHLDLLNVWKKNWLFAGYEVQIPKAGDFFTMDLANDSLIIMRGDDGKINAFFNSCRHRGSRIVPSNPASDTRNTKRLVCPYHQWSYDRTGKLVNARDMPADFDKSLNGLKRAHCQTLEGMIFINLAPIDSKPHHSFEDAHAYISPQIGPHGLKDAKIIHTDIHIINANWKLVYENNRECYHCAGGHPEYIMSNYDLAFSYVQDGEGDITRVVDPNHPNKKDIEKHIRDKTEYWNGIGLSCTPDNAFPGPGWYRASRQPLRKGFLNESTEGQLVCKKRMGTLPSDDMGSMRVHTLPNFWIHASSDHCASTRLTPINIHQTFARVDWMVHKDAVEGKDYDKDKVIAFWQITNAQDWKLCEVNQLGVFSSVYEPGRLSTKKELGLERYLNWYLREVEEPTAWMK